MGALSFSAAFLCHPHFQGLGRFESKRCNLSTFAAHSSPKSICCSAGISTEFFQERDNVHLSNFTSEASEISVPNDEIEALNNWLTTAGVSLHCVQIGSDQHGSRGLYATREIFPGDVILTIPHSAALVAPKNPGSVTELSLFRDLDERFWKQATWYTRLAILLLDHALRPNPSHFHSYIAALPKNPNTGLNAAHFLGIEQVASQLRPFRLDRSLRQLYKQTLSEFCSFQNALPAHSASSVSINDYIWALSTVFSRAFGCPLHPTNPGASENKLGGGIAPHFTPFTPVPPGDFALFPALDMANHSVRVGTTLQISEKSPYLAYDLVAGCTVGNREQVFVSYGSKCNDDLLLFYGFVESNSPANCVEESDILQWISTVAKLDADLEHECPLSKRRIDELRRRGLFPPSVAVVFTPDALDTTLMQLLRVAVATEDELGQLEKQKILGSQAECAVKALSLRNEIRAWKMVENRCLELLEVSGLSEKSSEGVQSFSSCDSVSWDWKDTSGSSDGIVFLQRERAHVLKSTIERARHFTEVSLAVGRICTVLLPPTQSVLRANAFDTNVFSGMPDMRFFQIHRDIQTEINSTDDDG